MNAIKPQAIDPLDAARLTLESVEEFKHLDCEHYSECLNIAVKRDWAGFKCGSCPHYQEMSRAQREMDALALRVMFEASENVLKHGHANRIRGVKPGSDHKSKRRLRLPVIMQRAESVEMTLSALVLA